MASSTLISRDSSRDPLPYFSLWRVLDAISENVTAVHAIRLLSISSESCRFWSGRSGLRHLLRVNKPVNGTSPTSTDAQVSRVRENRVADPERPDSRGIPRDCVFAILSPHPLRNTRGSQHCAVVTCRLPLHPCYFYVHVIKKFASTKYLISFSPKFISYIPSKILLNRI